MTAPYVPDVWERVNASLRADPDITDVRPRLGPDRRPTARPGPSGAIPASSTAVQLPPLIRLPEMRAAWMPLSAMSKRQKEQMEEAGRLPKDLEFVTQRELLGEGVATAGFMLMGEGAGRALTSAFRPVSRAVAQRLAKRSEPVFRPVQAVDRQTRQNIELLEEFAMPPGPDMRPPRGSVRQTLIRSRPSGMRETIERGIPGPHPMKNVSPMTKADIKRTLSSWLKVMQEPGGRANVFGGGRLGDINDVLFHVDFPGTSQEEMTDLLFRLASRKMKK